MQLYQGAMFVLHVDTKKLVLCLHSDLAQTKKLMEPP